MIKNNEVIVAGLLLLLEHYLEKQTNDDSFSSFDNPIFSFYQFVWDCGCESDEFDFHEPNCPLGNHNFLYKPTNFSIEWYKHIGRSMEYSDNISVEEFYKIINTCILSLDPDIIKAFKVT
ncbi:MAG: hypothetical protein WC503_04060 [Candidatus Shapirobacteria bacterium]